MPGHDAVAPAGAPPASGAREQTCAWAAVFVRTVNRGNRAELTPDPLNPGAIRATLRDPDGFGHIGWMIRLFGVFDAVARVPPPGFSNVVFPWGSGE